MNMTLIWVTERFVGFHRWKDAPADVAFLRDYHRHVFHVKLWKSVTGLDREIEFIQLKRELTHYLAQTYHEKYFDKSCEMIATSLLETFNAESVEVSEDGENGAIVMKGPDNG